MLRRNMIRAALLCPLPLLLALTGCEPKKPFRAIGPGTVTEQVWRNPDLGLELTLPEGWSVSDEEQKKQQMDSGAKALAGDDEQLAAALAEGSQRSVSLFSVFERPIGQSTGFSASLVGIAEDIRMAPHVKTPEDYFADVKKGLSQMSLKVSYPREPGRQTLGGQPFSVLYATMPVPGLEVNQRYFARRFDDYMLLVIASHATDEQKAALDVSLATLKFTAATPDGK